MRPQARGTATMAGGTLRAAIIGGGIGGLSAALALRARGIEVSVFERAPELGEVGAGLMLYPNSLRLLERRGLAEPLARVGARVGEGSEYYRSDGTVVGPIVTRDSRGWNGFYGMHRADLLNTLANALPASIVHTGHRCTGVNASATCVEVQFGNGRRFEADIVVAADG